MSSNTRSLKLHLLLAGFGLICGLLVVGRAAIQVYYPHREIPAQHVLRMQPPDSPAARRLILVLVDGLRHDTAFDPKSMPFLNRVKKRGAWGIALNSNLTLTNLAVVNIGTGRPPQITKVLQNFKNSPVQKHSMFTLLKRHGLRTAFIGHTVWKELFGHDAHFFRGHADRGIEDIIESDDEAMRVALPLIRQKAYRFMVVHYHGVDHAGHKYTAVSSHYRRLARRIDGLIEKLHRSDPNATMLVMSDHGMTDKGTHGGGEPECARVPFVFFGPGIKSVSNLQLSLDEFAPTLLALFGIPDLGSARGRIATKLLKNKPASLARLYQRYQKARLRYLTAMAALHNRKAPPRNSFDSGEKKLKSGQFSAALALFDRSNQALNRYSIDVLEDTSTLRYAKYAVILLLAMFAWLLLSAFGDPAVGITLRHAGAAGAVALATLILTLLGQTIASLISGTLLIGGLSILLLYRLHSRRGLLAAGVIWATLLGLVMVLATSLYYRYLAQRGITGWTVFLPDLDRWYMPRLYWIYGTVAGLTLLFELLRRRFDWNFPHHISIGSGLLIALGMMISIFYWEGNNMARLALLMVFYGVGLTLWRWKEGHKPVLCFQAVLIPLIAVALWQIGYLSSKWVLDFRQTYWGWFSSGIALLAVYLLWAIPRRKPSMVQGAALASIPALLAAAYAYRLLQTEWLVPLLLVATLGSVALLARVFGRAELHRILPFPLFAVYRILAQDIQMLVLVLGAIAIAMWGTLRERQQDLPWPLVTALWLVLMNLLIFFASGHFWNFSSVEVAIAFVGEPDEINLAWAISLIMLKYGIPWFLLINGLFMGLTDRPQTVVVARAAVATLFIYISMIAGLMLPFDTLKHHLEFGSKALPTTVFTYIHSSLFLFALASVYLIHRLSSSTKRPA